MKNYTFLLLVVLSITSCSQQKKQTYIEEIEAFQYKLNVEFSDKKTSPLDKKDFRKFKKLAFFPINKKFRIVADFKPTPNTPIFELKTSTDRLPLYRQYGIATFTIDGKKLSLKIYQSQSLMLDPEYTNHLSIFFNDVTNGNETYGAGRYIDLSVNDIKDSKIIIDFNKAYNPYCAYSHRYSCPIPPKDNFLDVEIKAGVLAFNKH